MRIFNTFQELWDYCLYCPVCKDTNRQIDISVGPDDNFDIIVYKKRENTLQLNCRYSSDLISIGTFKQGCDITFNIDMNNNTYEVIPNVDYLFDKTEGCYFFCYLYARCKRCDRSYLNTADIGFDGINQTLYNIQMDQEAVYLASDKDKFHISLCYDRNIMIVSRCEEIGEATSLKQKAIDDPSIIELPLVNLDFSDHNKIIEKIKTYIVFS